MEDAIHFDKQMYKDRDEFNPYIDFLQKNGIIGKNKRRYITNHINIDSSDRKKQSYVTVGKTIKLETDVFSFNGSDLRIEVTDTSNIKPNDKI